MSRRYTYPEAAEELRVSELWLRRHIKKLPHSKKGRVVTFSDEDLVAIDTMFHHAPQTGPVPLPASAQPHPLAHLKPMPSRRALRSA
jgi:hypothetical protein